MLTKNSIEKITKLLALPVTGFEQDWDVELADGTRVNEFVDAYRSETLGESDRFALMALILASVNSYLRETGKLPAVWDQVSRLLAQDKALHSQSILYWACEGEVDSESWFELTPHVRALWQITNEIEGR